MCTFGAEVFLAVEEKVDGDYVRGVCCSCIVSTTAPMDAWRSWCIRGQVNLYMVTSLQQLEFVKLFIRLSLGRFTSAKLNNPIDQVKVSLLL